ncbi:VapE domain-containing protein [Ramlibacter sp. MAHUQ-53]|uniref:VapE domain-containing protein n=1 Tax=unclassified Ramlibacter TaxID=2617605 RepID=UPI00364334BD
MRDGQKIKPLTTSPNLAALMALEGWRATYNEMPHRTELFKNGLISPRDDDPNTALTLLGDAAVRNGLNRENVPELVDALARQAPYHPVRDWITAVPWDGVDRRALFAATLELEDPETATLAHRLLHKWMLQGVGALMEPEGVTAAGMLVIAGTQHVGKTWWVRHLVPLPGAVAEGVTIDPSDKDSILRATGAFVTEVGELDGTMRKADIAQFKGFLTNNIDEVRLPYARRASFFKRRTVFVGTVNGSGFLVDETGNRRFWVIAVVRCLTLAPEVMQQVWAQYLHLYQRGERWNLEPDLLTAINAANRQHETVDPLTERIAAKFNWESVDLSTLTSENRTSHPGLLWMTATRICEAVGIPNPKKSEATRTAHIVKSQWAAQGHLLRNPGEVALLDRRANGLRLLAVPKKMAY